MKIYIYGKNKRFGLNIRTFFIILNQKIKHMKKIFFIFILFYPFLNFGQNWTDSPISWYTKITPLSDTNSSRPTEKKYPELIIRRNTGIYMGFNFPQCGSSKVGIQASFFGMYFSYSNNVSPYRHTTSVGKWDDVEEKYFSFGYNIPIFKYLNIIPNVGFYKMMNITINGWNYTVGYNGIDNDVTVINVNSYFDCGLIVRGNFFLYEIVQEFNQKPHNMLYDIDMGLYIDLILNNYSRGFNLGMCIEFL